jgi:hypothetical protein
MQIPSSMMYLSGDEVNNVLLVLICNKIGITPAEILEASKLYLEERQKTAMLFTQGEDHHA